MWKKIASYYLKLNLSFSLSKKSWSYSTEETLTTDPTVPYKLSLELSCEESVIVGPLTTLVVNAMITFRRLTVCPRSHGVVPEELFEVNIVDKNDKVAFSADVVLSLCLPVDINALGPTAELCFSYCVI